MNRPVRNSSFYRITRNQSSRTSSGFTLVEVLVVVAMIAMLLGLLVPALRAAKEKATTIRCLANLRFVGVAVRVFADDNEGFFPKVTRIDQISQQVWAALKPDLKSERARVCPRDPAKPIPPGGSYDFRVFTLRPEWSVAGVRLDMIPCAYRVPIGGDRDPGWHGPGTINVSYADGGAGNILVEDCIKWIRSPIR